jgi:hypothetical protein
LELGYIRAGVFNMAIPSLAEQMRDYQDRWVAVVEDPEEKIVGSGKEPLDARLDAENHGYHEATLLWVPPHDIP